MLPGEHHGHGGAAGIVKHTAAPCRGAREVACCSQHFGVFGADGQVDLLLCHIFWILFCGFGTPCPGSRLCFLAGRPQKNPVPNSPPSRALPKPPCIYRCLPSFSCTLVAAVLWFCFSRICPPRAPSRLYILAGRCQNPSTK